MPVAVVRGEAGREAIRATQITRQTIRGKEGGVYYVLAPGPSLMLAPTFRIDRALNRARGHAGAHSWSASSPGTRWRRCSSWCCSCSPATRPDARGSPPCWPSVSRCCHPSSSTSSSSTRRCPGRSSWRWRSTLLALRPERLARHPWLFGTLLATLPWLHQKFLPVWLVLAATAVWVMWRQSEERARGRQVRQEFLVASSETGLLGMTAAGRGGGPALIPAGSWASWRHRRWGST